MLEKCLAEGFTLQILLMSFIPHISGTTKARVLFLIKEYCLHEFLHPFSLCLITYLVVMVHNSYKYLFQSTAL